MPLITDAEARPLLVKLKEFNAAGGYGKVTLLIEERDFTIRQKDRRIEELEAEVRAIGDRTQATAANEEATRALDATEGELDESD
jgi:hypothetical protein